MDIGWSIWGNGVDAIYRNRSSDLKELMSRWIEHLPPSSPSQFGSVAPARDGAMSRSIDSLRHTPPRPFSIFGHSYSVLWGHFTFHASNRNWGRIRREKRAERRQNGWRHFTTTSRWCGACTRSWLSGMILRRSCVCVGCPCVANVVSQWCHSCGESVRCAAC